MNCKSKTCFLVFLGIIFVFSFPKIVFAQVVINEFQINPNQWIELYNKDENSVDISGWIIDDEGGTEKYIISSGTILPSKKCISFQSGKFNWNTNSGDTVRLLDSSSNQKEEYIYSLVPNEGVSVGKVIDGEGSLVELSSSSQDRFNATGESCLAPTPTLTLTPTPTQTPPLATTAPTQTPTPIPISYDRVSINEFLVDPENGNEKVEIKNNNNFSVFLVNWRIDDKANEGHSPTDTFLVDISPGGYYTYELASGFLNNDGDEVRLLDFTGTQKSQKSYSSSTKGLSWQRDPSGNWCEQTPSFNSENNNCPSSTSAPTSTPVPTSTPKPTPTPKLSPIPTLSNDLLASEGAEEILGAQTASDGLGIDLNQPASESSENQESKKKFNFWPLVFIVPGLGMISFSVLLLRKQKI